MKNNENWDWSTECKEVPIGEWKDKYNWVEEIMVSPDGEKTAAVVNLDDAEFAVCENGDVGDEVFEKAWSLKYTPEGKLLCFVASDEEWTVYENGELWEEKFDYIWNMDISEGGKHIGVLVQRDGEYGMAVNGKAWDEMYENITGAAISKDGRSAAIVQTEPLNQGDIEGFKRGVFAVAVDGELKTDKHMNIWDISFNDSGDEIACSIRKNRTDYLVGRNNAVWNDKFQCAWGPCFTSANELLSPVKKGPWFLYKDDRKFWDNSFLQITKITESKGNVAAIVSDKYGKWSVAENDKVWNFRSDMMIRDLFYGGNGDALVSVYKNSEFWDVAVNNSIWNLKADKLWNPKVSLDGSVLAVRMEKNGKYYLVVNGKTVKEGYEMVFDPEISPDGSKVLLKTLNDGVYRREVLLLDQVL